MSTVLAAITWHAVLLPLLTAAGLLSLLAVLKPSLFRRVAAFSSHSIDTSKLHSLLDTSIDIDRYILPHSRLFGTAVLSTVAACWFRLF